MGCWANRVRVDQNTMDTDRWTDGLTGGLVGRQVRDNYMQLRVHSLEMTQGFLHPIICDKLTD
jgi:hypothetical protein